LANATTWARGKAALHYWLNFGDADRRGGGPTTGSELVQERYWADIAKERGLRKRVWQGSPIKRFNLASSGRICKGGGGGAPASVKGGDECCAKAGRREDL